ncbi:hypothetical protein BH09MYX1_BH09MYX1_07220 [soil metagenome]
MGHDLITAVEAACAHAPTDAAWNARVLDALSVLDEGGGVILAMTEATEDGLVCTEIGGTASAAIRNAFRACVEALSPDHAALALRALGGTASMNFGSSETELGLGPTMRELGVCDCLLAHGVVDEGRTFGAYVPLATTRQVSPDMLKRFQLVGIHLAAGWRARGRSQAIPPRALDVAETSAIPNGDKRLAVWHGVVAGRWSLVSSFERSGRRYLVAKRNLPEAARLRRLTLREAEVVRLAVYAPSQKHVAYTLGISNAVVSRHLSMAMLKLGVTNRNDLSSMVRALGVIDDRTEAGALRSA